MKISTSNRSSFIIFLLFFCSGMALFFQAKTAWSQTDDKNNKIEKAPLHIVSDKMIAKRDQSMVEFIGNVKATRLDSVVLADSIQVYFNEDSKEDNSEAETQESNLKKIISTGNVEYTTGDRKAYADKAVYTAIDGTLILTGKAPRLVTGDSFVTGKKITLFRNQDMVLVESDGNKRVEALFNPEDSSGEKP